MKAPWWLNPRRERRRLLAAVEHWAADCGRFEQMYDRQVDDNRLLGYRNAELDRQLRIASDAGPGSGRAVIGWEQSGGAKPEFVLVGIDRGAAGGKRLYASRDLGGASFGMTEMDDPPPRFKLATAMANMLTIDKPSYGEAMRHMADVWANWDGAKAALPPGDGPFTRPQAPVRGELPWDSPNADVLHDLGQIERDDRERTSRPFEGVQGPFHGMRMKVDPSLPPGTVKLVSGDDEKVFQLPGTAPGVGPAGYADQVHSEGSQARKPEPESAHTGQAAEGDGGTDHKQDHRSDTEHGR